MKLMPTMLLGKKALLSEATRSARQAEHYAKELYRQLASAEEHLKDLQKHIPENAPRQTSEHLCKTMRKLEYYTKKIAKQAHAVNAHVEKLDHAVNGGHR